MMISTEQFVNLHESDDYYDLIEVRDELIRQIHAFEELSSPSGEADYAYNLVCLAEICRMLDERFREILRSPSRLNNFKRNLHHAMKISVDDDNRFDRSADALNECFNKHYKVWMQSGCFLNEEKTLRAWFPKMDVTEN